MVEILDATKRSSAREFLTHELNAPEPPVSVTDSAFQAGIVSFNLKPGTYTVVIEVNDKNSNRKFRDTQRTVILQDFSQASLEISDVIFFEIPHEDSPRKLVPLFEGGDIPFGDNARCYVQIHNPFPAESLQVTYRLQRSTLEEGVDSLVVRDTLSHHALEQARALAIIHEGGSVWYTASDSVFPHDLACLFDLAMDTLPQAPYQIDITARSGTSVSTTKKNFQLRWLAMPLSLRQFNFATELMEYILPEKEFKTLRSAGRREQRRLFDDFWKQRDPTPKTAFNEVMAEYYKRADYATSAFVTVREERGAKTERGKAYILYGPPSSIERTLRPSSDPQETWLYTNLHKKLIFVDEHRNGEYKLIAAESL